jgi:hypothetical protein
MNEDSYQSKKNRNKHKNNDRQHSPVTMDFEVCDKNLASCGEKIVLKLALFLAKF